MTVSRRDFVAFISAGAIAALRSDYASALPPSSMYGLIGKINANPGQRDALAKILVDGVSGMPGCLSYIVARDPANPDAIWVTEVWKDQDAHKASLSLPSVQRAIAHGRPMIAGFGERYETEPLGGHGLIASADKG
jgi:quinol monooxygenase YgiN